MISPNLPGRAMLRASLAVLVLFASLGHAAEDVPSPLAKVPLPTGAVRLDDRGASKALTGLVNAWVKERGLEPGKAPVEAYAWSGAGYKAGRSAVTRAALERALTADGYTVENFDRERVNLNPFDLLHKGEQTYELNLSSVDQQHYLVAVNAAKQRTVVGVWIDQENQKRQVLVLAEAGFKGKKADPLPLVQGDRVILVKDVANVMKDVPLPKLPEPVKLAVEARRARGTAVDAAGKPLAGAKVVIESSAVGGLVTSVTATTDAKGQYDVAVPDGVCKVVEATYKVRSNDADLNLELHPLDGEREHFPAAKGNVEHFVLRTHGERKSGAVRALWFSQVIPPGGTIEVTLTPVGKSLDGSDGYTFVIRLANKNGGDFTFENVPVGRYTMTARLLEDGEATTVRLKRATTDGTPADRLPVEFEPAGRLGVKRFDVALSF